MSSCLYEAIRLNGIEHEPHDLENIKLRHGMLSSAYHLLKNYISCMEKVGCSSEEVNLVDSFKGSMADMEKVMGLYYNFEAEILE